MGRYCNFEMAEGPGMAGWRFHEVELRDEIEESSYQGFGHGLACFFRHFLPAGNLLSWMNSLCFFLCF